MTESNLWRNPVQEEKVLAKVHMQPDPVPQKDLKQQQEAGCPARWLHSLAGCAFLVMLTHHLTCFTNVIVLLISLLFCSAKKTSGISQPLICNTQREAGEMGSTRHLCMSVASC